MTTKGQLYPGKITDKQYETWRKYRDAGGLLEIYEWVDANEITIEEEQAAIIFRERLSGYLDDQVASGSMTESEAGMMAQDVADRLLGQGNYAGLRETVIQLPLSIRNGVGNYWAGIPVAEQKKIEEGVKAYQKQEQDIARQKMQLPLNAGGKPGDQINAGYQAIRQLQIQRDVSPEYLKPTIDNQIDQLKLDIANITEAQRASVPVDTSEKEWQPPAPAPSAAKFAEKYNMSPEAAQRTALRYSQVPGSEEFGNLTDEQKTELSTLASEAYGGPPEKPFVPFEPPEFDKSGETGSPVWKSWFSRQYPTIASEFAAKGAELRTKETWATFLDKERARIREEFARQSPYSRGERPGEYAPKIKTVNY